MECVLSVLKFEEKPTNVRAGIVTGTHRWGQKIRFFGRLFKNLENRSNIRDSIYDVFLEESIKYSKKEVSRPQ